MNKRIILLVVAHPDDECLWAGTLLLLCRAAKLSTVCICLTSGDSSVRQEEFNTACHALGCLPISLSYQDASSVFPDLSKSLSAAIAAAGIAVSSIALVITHSPHGEERRHRQHIAAFYSVRNWCGSTGLAFGFFSDRPYQCLYNRITKLPASFLAQKKLRWSWRGLIVDCANDTCLWPPRIAIYGIWQSLRSAFSAKVARHLIRIAVRSDEKKAVLSNYASQISGIRQYAFVSAKYEWIYIENSSIAQELAVKLDAISDQLK